MNPFFNFFGSSSKLFPVNPHQLVKIWLTSNSQVFLNPTNQERLIETRKNNPHAKISLVYDSHLLTPRASKELDDFCRKHNINKVDIRACTLSAPLEVSLMALYDEEVKNLQNGGNLGAASDILRTFKEIRELGIYTDFDVDCTTHDLPEVVYIKRPLVLNIFHTSSWCIPVRHVINDVLISSPCEESAALFTKIQESILENYSVINPRKQREQLLAMYYPSVEEYCDEFCEHTELDPKLPFAKKRQQAAAHIKSIFEVNKDPKFNPRASDEEIIKYFVTKRGNVFATKKLIDTIVFTSGPKVYHDVIASDKHHSVHYYPELASCFSSPQLDQGPHPQTLVSGDASYTLIGSQRLAERDKQSQEHNREETRSKKMR